MLNNIKNPHNYSGFRENLIPDNDNFQLPPPKSNMEYPETNTKSLEAELDEFVMLEEKNNQAATTNIVALTAFAGAASTNLAGTSAGQLFVGEALYSTLVATGASTEGYTTAMAVHTLAGLSFTPMIVGGLTVATGAFVTTRVYNHFINPDDPISCRKVLWDVKKKITG